MEIQRNISFGSNKTERHEDLKRLIDHYLSSEDVVEYDRFDEIVEKSILRELKSKELDINYLEISDNNNIDIIRQEVINIIRLMTNIKTLNFSGNLIQDQKEYYSLSEAFNNLTNLTSINLSLCDIKNGSEIFENLRNCTELIHLDLRVNSISSGIESLAKAELRKLEYIDLSFNQIEPKGATSLAEVLRVNKSLTHVNFNFNKFGPEGATSLAEVLGELEVLTCFYLTDNMIQEKGATSIAKALRQSDTLVDLDIGDDDIGSEGAAYITEILAQCTALTRITIL
jgi:Ran GTPase-activating protein (RanGAP) involved in mRNA processing and transport